MFSQSDLMELARFHDNLKAVKMRHPHAGRPGHRGGSAPSGTHEERQAALLKQMKETEKAQNEADPFGLGLERELRKHIVSMNEELGYPSTGHPESRPTHTFTDSRFDSRTGKKIYTVDLRNINDRKVEERHARRVEVFFKTKGEKIKRAHPGARVLVTNTPTSSFSGGRRLALEFTLPGYRAPVLSGTRWQHALPRGMRASKTSRGRY